MFLPPREHTINDDNGGNGGGGTYQLAHFTMGIDDDNKENGGERIDEHNVPHPAQTYDRRQGRKRGGDISTSTMFLPPRDRMIQYWYGPTPRYNGGDIDVG